MGTQLLTERFIVVDFVRLMIALLALFMFWGRREELESRDYAGYEFSVEWRVQHKKRLSRAMRKLGKITYLEGSSSWETQAGKPARRFGRIRQDTEAAPKSGGYRQRYQALLRRCGREPLTALLEKHHITNRGRMVAPPTATDSVVADASKRRYANADELAAFLSGANPKSGQPQK
jgi:hypothetical protein